MRHTLLSSLSQPPARNPRLQAQSAAAVATAVQELLEQIPESTAQKGLNKEGPALKGYKNISCYLLKYR
jgi:hypothetical protein